MNIDAGRLAVAQLRREGVELLFSLNGGHVALIYYAWPLESYGGAGRTPR